MVALTEKAALQRARAKSLDSVVRLNCWNAHITDLSILRQMPNLEVLTLSVNDVTTLKDITSCTKLKELYIRKNRIEAHSELQHLRSLLCLRVLWLSENPCADDEDYRLRTVTMLPQLQFLDNVAIQDEERHDASSAALNNSQSQLTGQLSGTDQVDSHPSQPLATHGTQRTTAAKDKHVLSAVLTLLSALDADALQTVVMTAQNQLEVTSRGMSGAQSTRMEGDVMDETRSSSRVVDTA